MSRFIATSAIRGGHEVVEQAEKLYQEALATLGPDKPVAFPNTTYFLPVIYTFTGHKVQKIADLELLDKFTAKSTLTEKDVERLGRKVGEALAKRLQQTNA